MGVQREKVVHLHRRFQAQSHLIVLDESEAVVGERQAAGALRVQILQNRPAHSVIAVGGEVEGYCEARGETDNRDQDNMTPPHAEEHAGSLFIIFGKISILIFMRAPLKTPYLSFRRKPESSNVHTLWIPAFAGMTFLEVPMSGTHWMLRCAQNDRI